MPFESVSFARQNYSSPHRSTLRGWDESSDPRQIDRAADAELALGHHARAEYLAESSRGTPGERAMSAISPSKAEWEQAVDSIHREASGAVEIVIVMMEEMPGLLGEALLGNPRCLQLFKLVVQMLNHVKAAPRRDPVLCACCPRPVRQGSRFNMAVAIPARDDPHQALALVVCERCAIEPDAVMAKATDGLRKIWPDLRTAAITHPEGGRA